MPLPQVRLSSGLRMRSFPEQRLVIKARVPAAVWENKLALLTQGGKSRMDLRAAEIKPTKMEVSENTSRTTSLVIVNLSLGTKNAALM